MKVAEASGSPDARQQMQHALAIALGEVARTPVMAHPERSHHR